MKLALAHLLLSRAALKRKDYIPFLHAMARVHPELKRPVGWVEFIAICQRESITVRVRDLGGGQAAELVRLWGRVFIVINENTEKKERAQLGMHELTHYWRDDPKMPVYYATADWRNSPEEDFANVFSWMVTTTPRSIKGTFEEDFE